MTTKELPAQELLLKLFTYDKDTGEITNKVQRAASAPKGAQAARGHTRGSKRIRITIDGRCQSYLAHRIIWKLVTGDNLINEEIDHIDGNPSNNKWNNLRKATRAQQERNKEHANGYSKRGNKWRARIQHEGRRITIGTYPCPLLARLAYEDKAQELCPGWTRG